MNRDVICISHSSRGYVVSATGTAALMPRLQHHAGRAGPLCKSNDVICNSLSSVDAVFAAPGRQGRGDVHEQTCGMQQQQQFWHWCPDTQPSWGTQLVAHYASKGEESQETMTPKRGLTKHNRAELMALTEIRPTS